MDAAATGLDLDSIIPPAFVEVIEALARIQVNRHIHLPVPAAISQEEAAQVLAADRMLRGKPMDMTWSRVVVSVIV